MLINCNNPTTYIAQFKYANRNNILQLYKIEIC